MNLYDKYQLYPLCLLGNRCLNILKNTIYIAMAISDWTKFVQIIEHYSRNIAVKI